MEITAQDNELKLLRAVAFKLVEVRQQPPTIIETLFKWPGTPMLVMVGVTGTALLELLSDSGGAGISLNWTSGFAAMTFRAFLRDVGVARRVEKLWATQTRFIDWEKVDEVAGRKQPLVT